MTSPGWQVGYGATRLLAVTLGWLAVTPARRALTGQAPVLAGALPELAERLGPAYVKVAQLASTREDVLPASWCRALRRLQENGRPDDPARVRRILAAHGLPAERVHLLGAGSVACVYLVEPPGAPPVAVKILRPGVRAAMTRDLTLLRRTARLLVRVPRLRHLPLVDMVEHIADAVAGQVELDRERSNLTALRTHLDPASVEVPAAHPGGSRDVLIMDFLPAFTTAGEPAAEELAAEKPAVAEPAGDRREAARGLVEAVFNMLFTVGLVHCDLHPGNIRIGADGRVCIVDAGFVVTADETLRRRFCEFFVGLALGNGPRCAAGIVDAAVIRPATLDRVAFDAEVTDIVHRYTGLTARDFSIAAFVDELFALQRRHRLFVSASFVVPILTLLVIEGTVRAWDPDLDFQALAYPIVLGALVRLPRKPVPAPEAA